MSGVDARRIGPGPEPDVGPKSDARRAGDRYRRLVSTTPRLVKWLPGAYFAAIDIGAAVAATLIYLGFAETRSAEPLWLGYLIAFAVGVPLVVRRRWPVAVFCVVLAAQNTATVMGITLEPYFPTLFALYLVAVALPRRRSSIALLAGAVSAGASIVVSEPWPDDLGLALTVCLLMVTTWALGWTTQVRRSYVDRTNAERAEKALAQERLRIARELHDIVAHSLTLIAVKAGIAHHLAASRPQEAQAALGVIETTSRETLVEMRHLLGVLRSEEAEPEFAPVPGLRDLAGLADRAGMAGVPVSLEVSGDVPDGVGLTVYRIVQEAVTNVVKHAAPARCHVVVSVADDVARIEVTDDGAGERVLAGGGGHGLIGMRERVAMYGGSFTAGPQASGGFRVAAEVPFA